MQSRTDGLDGTVPQGNIHLRWIEALSAVGRLPAPGPAKQRCEALSVLGPVVEGLADAVEGVDEPLVGEVVLALDKTAELTRQLELIIIGGDGGSGDVKHVVKPGTGCPQHRKTRKTSMPGRSTTG